jgi:hypothetical protein
MQIGELAIVGGATHVDGPQALWLWSMLQSISDWLKRATRALSSRSQDSATVRGKAVLASIKATRPL